MSNPRQIQKAISALLRSGFYDNNEHELPIACQTHSHTLADLYEELTMPADLRAQKNDRAVAAA